MGTIILFILLITQNYEVRKVMTSDFSSVDSAPVAKVPCM